MAQSTSALAFEDEFTHSHGGSCYFVRVDPVFEDQITDAVTLIARSRPENVRVSYISQFATAAKEASPNESAPNEDEDDSEGEESASKMDTPEQLAAKQRIIRDLLSSLKQLRLETSDRELEGFTNLLLDLIFSLFPTDHPDLPTLLFILSDALSFNQEKISNPSLVSRYSALATIFSSLPSAAQLNSLRLALLLKLISFATNNQDFSVVAPAVDRLESYLQQWEFGLGTQGEEEGNAAISTVVDALLANGKTEQARKLLVSHLSAVSAVNGSAATPSASAAKLASILISLSLSLPTIYDFSSIANLPAIQKPSVPELFELFTIFQSGQVAKFEAFVADSNKKQILSQENLDSAGLTKKLKLLALTELCSDKVGVDVDYKQIAEALQLELTGEDEGELVESWVIDAIRACLISGRLSQSNESFHVTRAAPRAFTESHWEQVETRLQGWRTSLDNILESVGKGINVDGGHSQGAAELTNGEAREVSVA